MTIADYRSTSKLPLRQATLVFLLRENEVLLAMKKRGFGAGHWNGVGGKVEDGEAVEAAALREAREEIGVMVTGMQEVASLRFYFPHKPEWDQEVTVYVAEAWDGEPVETEEMRPAWFARDAVPYHEMWSDDHIWLPQVLAGARLRAEFVFDERQGVADYAVEEW